MSSFIRNRPFSALLLVLLLALVGWGWHERVALMAFPDIISAYTAKEYCSCRYVMGNDTEYCLSYVKQWLPTSGFYDDAPNKRITVSGMGRTNRAAWIGERQGCRSNP